MKKGTLNPENFISPVQVPLFEHIIEFCALKLLFDFCPINARKPLKYQGFSLSINLKFYFCGVHAASFVFPLTCAAEKHIISEKPLNKWFFKGTGVVLAGIECSPKIFDFRASGIPVRERVDFFDTLKYRPDLGDGIFCVLRRR